MAIDNINNLKFGDDDNHDVLGAFDEFKKKFEGRTSQLNFDLVKVEKICIDYEEGQLVVDVVDRWLR